MTRILIMSLALCLLLLSAGKGYANADAPASNGAHDMMSMHTCNVAMTQMCDEMDSGDGFFSHFHCHLNMTSLISDYSSIGPLGPPSPSYSYQFSSKVHIQTLAARPPLFT